MKRKTFYVISAVWFVMVLITVAASFLPIVDEATQNEVKKYIVWVVAAGAVGMIIMRRMVEDDNN